MFIRLDINKLTKFSITTSIKFIFLFQCELAMILYPIFVHMYLELVFNDHEASGRNSHSRLVDFDGLGSKPNLLFIFSVELL